MQAKELDKEGTADTVSTSDMTELLAGDEDEEPFEDADGKEEA